MSALRALGHLAAIAGQFLWQVWRTDATLLVPRDSVVDELWIWKVQVGHDDLELFESFLSAQSWITLFFLPDRGYETLLVVVRWVDQGLVGQSKQLFSHALVERVGIPVLEVSPAAPLDEQGVARRSEERRVGKACGSTIRSRGSP